MRESRGLGLRHWAVSADCEDRYDVVLVDDVFDSGNPALARFAAPAGAPVRRLVIIDDHVERLYGERIRGYCRNHGIEPRMLPLAVSEERKTMETVLGLVDAIDEFGLDRHEPIIAIGGGVLLDVVGVTAGIYRRSTPYLRVPTTLVGLVDAGVGAKTAVNHGRHKNRLGAYHPPVAALLDRRLLATLPARRVADGLAEILKIALVLDRELFELLTRTGAGLVRDRFQRGGAEVLDRAVTGMLAELGPNLREKELQRRVDFGHSISPAIEMRALPRLLHGEAVAIDMALFAAVSCRRGLLRTEDRNRIVRLLRDLGLPTGHELLTPPVLREALAETTRHRGGRQRMPLLRGIGSVEFHDDLTDGELVLAAKELGEL